jgi:nucleotide-binding universal stress UspA family protein
MSTRYVAVGVDFTEPSLQAAHWTARHLVGDRDLVLAHAVHIPEPPAFIRGFYPPSDELVNDAVRGADLRLRELSLALGVGRVWPEVRVGAPDDVLVRVADDFRADLLVLGPGRKRPGIWKMLGSTAERVVRRGSTSVLLGRNLRHGPPRRILVALDDSRMGASVLAAAARLAEPSGAAITVMHVLSPTWHGAPIETQAWSEHHRVAEFRQRARTWLREKLQDSPLHNAAIDVAFGDPGFELVSAARRLDADMLVIGRHGARASAPFLGSVVEFVLRQGNEAVLVVDDRPGADA